MQIDRKQVDKLNKDLDSLFTDIAQTLASAPKMKPMVDKVRQGMSENAMKFENHEIWEHNKKVAKRAGIIEFDSPLMTTGQLVQDFIFYAGKKKFSQLSTSNDFIMGGFTWADKQRKRPTSRHILNQIAKKRGYGKVDNDATEFTYIKTSDLVKMIMRSPRYPIMDSIVSLYAQDIFQHCERLIDEAFKKRA